MLKTQNYSKSRQMSFVYPSRVLSNYNNGSSVTVSVWAELQFSLLWVEMVQTNKNHFSCLKYIFFLYETNLMHNE